MFKWLRPRVTNIIVQLDRQIIKNLDRRNTELLHHNTEQLNEIRKLKTEISKRDKLITDLADCAMQNHDLLIKHSKYTRYCGCNLELRTVTLANEAKAITGAA